MRTRDAARKTPGWEYVPTHLEKPRTPKQLKSRQIRFCAAPAVWNSRCTLPHCSEGRQWSDCRPSDMWAFLLRRRAGGKGSKGYGAEWDAHEIARKTPSFLASRIESGSGRARIAKERRGSDAMAHFTGLHQCSPLPCVSKLQTLPSVFSAKFNDLVVFWRNALCDCAQSARRK